MTHGEDSVDQGYDRIVVRHFGGPEELKIEHEPSLPEPGPGEVRVAIEAAGVGFTDTILRRGKYIDYKGGLPLTPGYDLVGIVDKPGEGVSGLTVGQRVADMPMNGGYSQYFVGPAEDFVPVPDGITPEVAVDVPLMWMTAWQMLRRCPRPPVGSAILVVGASGSVGRALVLLGRHLGLTVIGTCSAGNMAQVEALGAIPIDYRRPDLAAAIKAASGGGVAVAYDAIAGRSWKTSWRSLAKGGVLVGYGAQGFVDGEGSVASVIWGFVLLNAIWPKLGRIDGSTRTATFYNILLRRRSHPDEYRADMIELFDLIASVKVPAPHVQEVLPLSAAAEAHKRIAQGGLTGRLVLKP
ncbi:zinc-binding dehydrogenase [Sphingomonas montanisoli]|uniref:Zinc-binding dehydrogenase n=1 Tax=Sphingomonas montanisoli TaxID=2606412 RepID=A0A5D9C988_9SPHN|nr:zinc-binding dehydrogenase [Sphingomonas montanisoli]TZG27837.1 zinc-binding dehydrogenase [Sphingomonas montanisoli]